MTCQDLFSVRRQIVRPSGSTTPEYEIPLFIPFYMSICDEAMYMLLSMALAFIFISHCGISVSP